ncbi:antibiotic biosynthesis monooxygenase [Longimonas halophila]|uniref:Antibiotic biosynthesis monooxygenase n=1 Tax=Longimonas halophila TaxID=1469170 RepID=A0A2H3NIA8_9BACT|nr:antibiotic biosynthesis monooxygenase [Longimonas halophila]PEN05174.1 antibiotic biosynthesis monooxygenase [Longimonas halophila]
MIARIWHGWTTPEQANTYEQLLNDEIFPSIAAKDIDGYRGIQLLRREHDSEVEFVTIIRFESWDAVKQFAGAAYERAHVPDSARAVLSRFDAHAQHYEVRAHHG